MSVDRIGCNHPVAMRALLAVLALLAAAAARAEPIEGGRPQGVDDRFVAEPPVRVESWVEGLETPWSLVFLPDGRALVSERPGRIRLIEQGRLRDEPYARIDGTETVGGLFDSVMRLVVGGEAGLMGLALHPDFPRQPYVYAMHTLDGANGIQNRAIRLRHEGARATPETVIVDGIPGARIHDGGRIAFGPDRMLYVATGDASRAALAQDRASLAGKILRVDAEGAVPNDNPFPGSPVWSLGHRNPQGLAWHPETRQLFVAEHGPTGEFGLRAYDEINVVVKGGNYGWPRAVGAAGDARYRDPLVAWPERATPPGGIAFWRGDLYVTTLRSQALIRVALDRAGEGWRVTAIERWFNDGSDGRYGRLRDAVVGPDGALYVLTSNRDGRGSPRRGDDRILRITPR
ncbi:MAG TPA: PQQ-dependent sugar dehydrogenase [Alphaproteobacteria bacterium]